MKQCRKCLQYKPLENFYPHKRMKDGKQSWCKVCSRMWHRERPEYVKEKNKKYKEKFPTYHRDWQRKKNFNISKEELDFMREKQNGKCPICQVSLKDVKECVDHSHKSGKVRGLVCNNCNLALGYLKDNIDSSKRLTEYLLEAEAY